MVTNDQMAGAGCCRFIGGLRRNQQQPKIIKQQAPHSRSEEISQMPCNIHIKGVQKDHHGQQRKVDPMTTMMQNFTTKSSTKKFVCNEIQKFQHHKITISAKHPPTSRSDHRKLVHIARKFDNDTARPCENSNLKINNNSRATATSDQRR